LLQKKIVIHGAFVTRTTVTFQGKKLCPASPAPRDSARHPSPYAVLRAKGYSKSIKRVATKAHKMRKKKLSVLEPFVPPCGYTTGFLETLYLEALLHERTTRSGLEISLERDCSLFVAESNGSLDEPGFVLRSVRDVASIVSLEPSFQVLCQSDIIAAGMSKGLENVNVME
jgi:hypothetical protein